MTTHRLLYLDLNPPQADAPPPADFGKVITRGLLLFFAVVLTFSGLAALSARQNAVVVTPVRAGEIERIELPPLQSVEDARIEGFRAGLAQGIEQGCSPTALTTPIATDR